jgi:hypothetical protein
MPNGGRLTLAVLLLASLACNLLAPAAQPTVTPAATAAPTATLAAARTTATQLAPTAPGTNLRTAAAVTASPPATEARQALPFTLDSAAEAQAAMLPQFADVVASLPRATRYVIDVTVTFDGARSATLAGRALIRYTNPYSLPLSTLMLMLWPNDSDEYLGQMTLGTVTVGGAPVTPNIESRGIAARLPLAQPLAPGQTVDVAADFTTRAEAGLEQGARFGLTHGVLIAPTFYPIIPRVVNGDWQSAWPPSAGDVTNSDTAFYAYRLTAPAGMAIAASGVVVDQAQSGDTQTETLLTGPMRDIALAIGDLKQTQVTTSGGVRVNAWTLPEHAAHGPALAQEGAAQVDNLDNQVGPYPFAELDIVDAPGAYGGVEYPGLVYIGVVGERNGFEEATVHEVGHQWFYSLVGDDQVLQPWLDEAAASYTEVLYAEKVHGAAAAQRYLSFFQDEESSASDTNLPIGLGVGDYPSANDYYAVVYGKGALFFARLRQQLGDTTFFNFLHAYFKQYEFGFATSLGFEQVAEATCSCDLNGLFQQWVFGK